MKATGSASLFPHAPAGFCSHPSRSSYFCDGWHLESGRKVGKEKRKENGRRKQGPQDSRHQVQTMASIESCGEAGLQRKGRSAEQGKCQRKEHRSKACGERRPLQRMEQSR